MIRSVIKTQGEIIERMMTQAPAHDPVKMDQARTLLAEAMQLAQQAMAEPKGDA